MPGELTFKLGTSVFIIAEIVFLSLILFVAFQEYEGSHQAVGLYMAVMATAIGLAAMVFSLHQILKWKPI